MTDDTPAKYAKIHYFDERKNNFRGRPITKQPVIINKDLEIAAAQQHSNYN